MWLRHVRTDALITRCVGGMAGFSVAEVSALAVRVAEAHRCLLRAQAQDALAHPGRGSDVDVQLRNSLCLPEA